MSLIRKYAVKSINYTATTIDPNDVVNGIRKASGNTLTNEARAKLEKWLEENRNATWAEHYVELPKMCFQVRITEISSSKNKKFD